MKIRLAIKNFFGNLLLVEWAQLLYACFTSLLVFFFWTKCADPFALLSVRLWVSAGVLGLAFLYMRFRSSWLLVARWAYPLLMLDVWYPDTFEFCRHLPNLDHVFASWDWALTGCEPAYEMSRWLSGKVWSELFNMGYVSYFLMIALAAIVPLCVKKSEVSRTVFVVTVGFFAYYLIYLFLPVAGPQFYFTIIDPDAMTTGIFPSVSNYFDLHPDAVIGGNDVEGFFQSLVVLAHQSGERPVAAFPSSHVGMSTVIMMLLWRLRRSVCIVMLPLYVLLCGATVYIGAHYMVDVFGGWVTAVIFFYVFDRLYLRLAPEPIPAQWVSSPHRAASCRPS